MTTVLYEAKVDSVEKLLKSDIQIFATKRQLELQLITGKIPKELSKNFFIEKSGDEDIVVRERDAMNTNFGYMTPSDRWSYFAKQQELLRRPLFTYSEICTGRYYVTYPMKHDSHLEEPLKYCIMLCQQYGLIKAWTDQSFRDAIDMDMFKILKDENPSNFRPLNISFLNIGWFLLLNGLIISGIVFMIEFFVNKYDSK